MSTDDIVVAESWEDADADPVKELEQRVQKVKLLQRKQEDKEAHFEKIKSEQTCENTANSASDIVKPITKVEGDSMAEGPGPSQEEPKRFLLRRPKDGDEVSEPSDSAVQKPNFSANNRGRNRNNKNQKSAPLKTFEERQAEYQAARNRILGSEYKPDNNEIKEITLVERSKSPETVKMTHENMVQHYGAEFSNELMQEPQQLPHGPMTTLMQDFSVPPPSAVVTATSQSSVSSADPSVEQSSNDEKTHAVFNGPPPGFPAQTTHVAPPQFANPQQKKQKNHEVRYNSYQNGEGYQFNSTKNQYTQKTVYYGSNNGGGRHQNGSMNAKSSSSSSSEFQMDHRNQRIPFVAQQLQSQQQYQMPPQYCQMAPLNGQNYANYQGAPNMAHIIPPNFTVPPPPLYQPGPPPGMPPMPNRHPQRPPTNLMNYNGQPQQQQNYQQQPQQYQMNMMVQQQPQQQYQQNNGNMYMNRNGGSGRGNNNQNNKKKNGKNQNNVPPLAFHPQQFTVPPPPIPHQSNHVNPIPFGCPPMSVNQYSDSGPQSSSTATPLPLNNGVGLLGPHPYSQPPPQVPSNQMMTGQNGIHQMFQAQTRLQ